MNVVQELAEDALFNDFMVSLQVAMLQGVLLHGCTIQSLQCSAHEPSAPADKCIQVVKHRLARVSA
jgi:hypothetical protein